MTAPDVEAMGWAAEYIKELIATADEESEECYAQPLRDKAGLISALLALAREAAALREALESVRVSARNAYARSATPAQFLEIEAFARRALIPAEKETPND